MLRVDHVNQPYWTLHNFTAFFSEFNLQVCFNMIVKTIWTNT